MTVVRNLFIRVIGILLIVNGVAGVAVVVIGWRITTDLLDGLRQSSATLTAQQAHLVESMRGVAVGVDDASQAAGGLSRSTTQVRNSVTDATRTANELATTFDRLSEGTQVTVFGVRPLEQLTEPFKTNARDFRQLSASLDQTGASLADNVREMTRVGDDLRSIQAQIKTTAANIEAIQSAAWVEQAVAGADLWSRLLLGMIFFEATLSALTGVALLMLFGRIRALAT
jgi:hypothetical protein